MNPVELERLPGSEVVLQGLEDIAHGRESAAAAAVQMAAARLRDAGIAVPETRAGSRPPAHRLYDLLADEHGDAAHSRYNAVVRRVVSFARAAEHAGRS